MSAFLLAIVTGAGACVFGLRRLVSVVDESVDDETYWSDDDLVDAAVRSDLDALIADCEAVCQRLQAYLDREPCDLIDEGQLMLLSNAHRRVEQVLRELRRPRAVAS